MLDMWNTGPVVHSHTYYHLSVSVSGFIMYILLAQKLMVTQFCECTTVSF